MTIFETLCELVEMYEAKCAVANGAFYDNEMSVFDMDWEEMEKASLEARELRPIIKSVRRQIEKKGGKVGVIF